MFDKLKVRTNFSKASSTYDENALLQKMVAKKLVEFAKDDLLNATKIIDLGAGTGFITGEILSEFPQEKFLGKEILQLDISEKMLAQNPYPTTKIVADIENLPFAENSFDLALSSLSFQWLNDLKSAIPQILKTLEKGKNLHFAILGSESLRELKQVKEACKIPLSINEFIDENTLKEILKDFNFCFQKEEIILNYQDCFDLLKSIKKIGANYNQNKKILNKSGFELLNNFYLKNFNLNNRVFASWQIFYIRVQNQ